MEKVTAILYHSRMKLEKDTVKVYGRSNEEFYEQVSLAYRAKRGRVVLLRNDMDAHYIGPGVEWG